MMDSSIDNPLGENPTYAEALAAAGQAGAQSLLFDLSVAEPPYPKIPLDLVTQVKLVEATRLMCFIGKGPGDVFVDQQIPFRRLGVESLDWLEQAGIPARRRFAPLAAQDHYIGLFGSEERLPVSSDKAGRFFGLFIHCLAIESELLIAMQYYHGLGLATHSFPLSVISQLLSPEEAEGIRLSSMNQIDIRELRGRIFFEYCVLMIRAQWDKMVRLSCLVFDINPDWDSIAKGTAALDMKARDGTSSLHPFCRYHLSAFVDIAKERLPENGWLQLQRNALMHKGGQHSSGFLPQAKSFHSTTELWLKMRDGHNWLREAMMAALIVFLTRKSAT
jgi:hypothetical protein